MSDKCNPNYLLKTYPQYKSKRYDDGICYIQTRFKGPEFGSLTFDVYVYSDTYLAACVPPRTGTSLLNRFPEKFKLHQDAQDGKILLFREEQNPDDPSIAATKPPNFQRSLLNLY